MNAFCECNSTSCKQLIDIEAEQLVEIKRMGYIVISDDCNCGPETSDEFIRQDDGYKVYKPKD